MEKNLSTTYNPKDYEDRIYKFWKDGEYFKAKVDKNKEPFTIVMPPPNVTGELHMGHAIQTTIQDLLIRTKRMQGYSALWLPGTDHASISTEARVVDKLKREGKTKEEIGREEFLKETWEWTHKYGGIIKDQIAKLGASCDWSRERFTLDEGMTNAVEEVFIKLYEKGLIYRGNRIINWCPNCKTSISDAEVEHEDQAGKIYHVRYKLLGEDGYIEIATTRPETILGDLAIAVNPEDERYTDLIGKKAIVPLTDREIPIIGDSYVEMDFGSGALKITPSHDPNDFEIGLRHNLGQLLVIDQEGKINENGGKYQGLDRFEARKIMVEDLDKEGFLVGIKDHDNAVGHCERCSTVIEPLVSDQWFVKMKPLVEPVLKEFKENHRPKIIPSRFDKIYLDWLENIRDWNISRQLWWGHRLPVYYCESCDEIVVAKEAPAKCKCGSSFYRDPDTLDTWFSSALWPFATLGWPEKTEDLDYFYPTNLLVTGYDIIFFWVIRMVFSGLEQMGELPFEDVFLTGLIRDEQGRKMSKSLDNGIDPLELIDKYGADALRFSLTNNSSPGNDMRFSYERVEASRNFANKLWNASRFVLMNLEEGKSYKLELDKLEEEDKWILTKLNESIRDITKYIDSYELGFASQRVHDFIWEDYCDWYIELVKDRLYGEDLERKHTAEGVLIYVLKDILKLLHPFMPYITEEIWSHLPDTKEALIISSWPLEREDLNFEESLNKIEYIKNAIKAIRNARSELNIVPSKKSNQIFYTKDESTKDLLLISERYFKALASAESIEIIDDKSKIEGDNISIVLDKCEVFLPLDELIDYEKELERLKKEEEKLLSEIKRAEGKLNNQAFVSKAPEKLVNEEREKLAKFKEMLEVILVRIKEISFKIK